MKYVGSLALDHERLPLLSEMLLLDRGLLIVWPDCSTISYQLPAMALEKKGGRHRRYTGGLVKSTLVVLNPGFNSGAPPA